MATTLRLWPHPARSWRAVHLVSHTRNLLPTLTFHVPYLCPPRSYSVVLNQKKLPMGLLSEPSKAKRMNLLTTESFQVKVAL